MKFHALWLSASVLAFAGSGVAVADTAAASSDTSAATSVPEVVVTADRRTTNLQKTAIAATVRAGSS